MAQSLALFWFRRDLRLHDNAGLFHALTSGLPVLPVFIFDANILDPLRDRRDARVSFIHHTLEELQKELVSRGSNLVVAYGDPLVVWQQWLANLPVAAVYTNHDYEPYALQRDAAVEQLLQHAKIPLHTFKDHVIFEKCEIAKGDGLPYTVFTPYRKAWERRLAEEGLPSYASAAQLHHLAPQPSTPLPSLSSMGFDPSTLSLPSASVAQSIIKQYDQTRDIPSINGTSRLGIHFRFGTISIREKVGKAQQLNATYLSELIWRDFYAQILANFPHVAGRAFKPAYDAIVWRNDAAEFAAWCAGQTGYPMVDAGMRELNATGFMHNRARMITASFLTKHLLIDWRWGEAYFAEKLLDFDLASNNGGWQWAAGSGTDAAPYFRIFSPQAQQDKFDPQGIYIKRWVPEWGSNRYSAPIVDHQMARQRCLAAYQAALKPN